MYQQLWGYKVEEKLYLGVREQKRLNPTGVVVSVLATGTKCCGFEPGQGDEFFKGNKSPQRTFLSDGK
jgi:hypothetical protein